MNLAEQTETLRRHLDELTANADDELVERYELKRPPVPPGLYWQLRWLAGTVLHWLKSIGIWPSVWWPVSLKQSSANFKAKPLLIWAVGADSDTLRAACDGLYKLCDELPEFAPVLVTDVADFAFYSRLGWLVEYVPRLAGEGEPYENRKAKFLVRLYRGAPALPVRAGLEVASLGEDIRRWLKAQ